MTKRKSIPPAASQPDDDDIDLLRYVRLVAANWPWLVVPAILGLAAALVAGLALPPSYEAVALVSIDQATDRPSDEALLEFALSDGVLERTLGQLPGTHPAAGASLGDFRRDLSAHNTRPLVVLTARSTTADAAATIANLWAATLRNRLNSELRPQPGSPSPEELAADQAKQAWREAEAKWLDSDAQLLSEQQLTLRRTALNRQSELENQDRRLRALSAQLDSLAQELQAQGADQPASRQALVQLYAVIDELARLGLGSSVSGPTEADVLLANGGTGTPPNAVVMGIVESLGPLIEARQEMIQAEREDIEAQLAGIGADLSAAEQQLSELEIDRDLARQSALDRLKEANARSGNAAVPLARVSSQASPPTEPRSPRPARDGILAAAAGALIGFGGLLGREWRRAHRAGAGGRAALRAG